MDAQRRRELIERYADGHRVVGEALEKLGEVRLDEAPAGGDGWTARRVAHHLADSEMTSALRLRRMIAEDTPAIMGYPEAVWAERVHYDDRPVGASLEAFRWARASTVEILKRMSEAEWARKATHSELGAYSVEEWLEIYARHAHEHAEQILRIAEGRG